MNVYCRACGTSGRLQLRTRLPWLIETALFAVLFVAALAFCCTMLVLPDLADLGLPLEAAKALALKMLSDVCIAAIATVGYRALRTRIFRHYCQTCGSAIAARGLISAREKAKALAT